MVDLTKTTTNPPHPTRDTHNYKQDEEIALVDRQREVLMRPDSWVMGLFAPTRIMGRMLEPPVHHLHRIGRRVSRCEPLAQLRKPTAGRR